jgi:hypothetical protein
MDENLHRLALGIAGNTWKGARLARQSTWDLDDLRQEAALAAWQWGEAHPDWNADLHRRAITAKAIRYDLIDYMRSTGSGKRNADGTFPHGAPRSLDEVVNKDDTRTGYGRSTTLADLLHDEHAQDDLERVERDHDVRRAFEQHRGNPRHAAAAWLNLHGHPLAAIGAHYGVTEARACQYRRAFIDATAERWAAADSEAESQAA